METICPSCRAESNYQNTHCVHRQPENYCHEHGLLKPCFSCSQIEYDKQQERYETFKAVCLKLIRESSMTEWALNFNIAEAMTESILTAAQEFSTKGKVGR